MKKILIFIMTVMTMYTMSLEGLIDKYPIGMELELNDDGSVDGNYYYLKYKTPLKLIGTYNEEKVEVQFYDNGQLKEEFDLYFAEEIDGRKRLIGYWYMGDKDLAVELREGEIDFDSIDPLADMYIEEVEMKIMPQLVFNSVIDLGSGWGSPTEVEYYSQGSLLAEDFMQPVAKIVEEVRSDGSSYHSGTIIYAQWRSYAFELLRHSYYPKDEAYRGYHSLIDIQKWLLKWSFESIYNRSLYNELLKQIGIANEEILKYYMNSYSEEKAKLYRDNVIYLLYERAAGSFSMYYKDEYTKMSDLLLAIVKGKDVDYAVDLAKTSSREELIEGIKAAILLDRGIDYVVSLIDIDKEVIDDLYHLALDNIVYAEALGRRYNIDLEKENGFGKTAIFYAVQYNNLEVVKLLVEAGANINKQYKNTDDISWEYDIFRGERSVFMHAAMHSDIEILEYLVEQAIDINLRDEHDENAINYTDDEVKIEYLKSLGLEK